MSFPKNSGGSNPEPEKYPTYRVIVRQTPKFLPLKYTYAIKGCHSPDRLSARSMKTGLASHRKLSTLHDGQIIGVPMLDVSAVYAVYAINFYQRHLSPYKGFQCAYRVHTGRCSCSEYAKRIVRKRGVGALFVALPRQFARCRSAYTALLATQATQTREQRRQRPSRNRENKTDWCQCGELPFELSDLPCDIGPCDCSF